MIKCQKYEKKVNDEKKRFYDEIKKNKMYLDGSCHFSHTFNFWAVWGQTFKYQKNLFKSIHIEIL